HRLILYKPSLLIFKSVLWGYLKLSSLPQEIDSLSTMSHHNSSPEPSDSQSKDLSGSTTHVPGFIEVAFEAFIGLEKLLNAEEESYKQLCDEGRQLWKKFVSDITSLIDNKELSAALAGSWRRKGDLVFSGDKKCDNINDAQRSLQLYVLVVTWWESKNLEKLEAKLEMILEGETLKSRISEINQNWSQITESLLLFITNTEGFEKGQSSLYMDLRTEN
ncbi:hypothetical protein BS50DRAFT_655776, partial [Corynespora cassiicola Philippines]